MYYSYLEDVYDSYFENMNSNKLYHKLPNNCNKQINTKQLNNNKQINNDKININNGGGKMTEDEAKRNQNAIKNQDKAIHEDKDAFIDQQDTVINNINAKLAGNGLKKNFLENENNYILIGLLLLFFVDCFYKF